MSMSETGAGAAARRGRRILYLSKHFGYPLGGVRIAHHHVAMLNRNGFDARIVLVDNNRDSFFEEDIPYDVLGPSFALKAGDIFVIPEPWGDQLKKLERFDVRRLMFCQNHFYLYHGLGPRKSFEDRGLHGVFSCSEVIADYIKRTFQVADVPIIHNGIDHTRFRPAQKKRQIALMPRKMRIEANFIVETFQRTHPQLADVPVVVIDGMTEGETAEILAESAVFLAMSRLEGFGLPPIEAMASGCIVVGFMGDGGRSYATEDNGIWCGAEDWFAAADGLAAAIRAFDGDGGDSKVRHGLETASHYTLERMERDVVSFWTREITR
ncbi:MAG: glycosyltransferase [Thalassobaculaceae bacterium]|nr:glycosyltransferase [Thalassobaculaceae bacterium]